MRCKLFPLFVLVFVCSLAAHAQRVIESESSIVFSDKIAELNLVISSADGTGNRNVALELLDSGGNIRATGDPTIRIRAGKQTYKLQLSVGDLLKKAGDDIAWYRLRYRLGDSGGIISLSELLKDDFELRVAAVERAVPGQTFQARIRALHPLTQRPIKRVAIDGELTLDLVSDSNDDKLKIKASGVTDSDGMLEIKFKVPESVKLDGGNLKIRGDKNGMVRTIDEDLDDDQARGSVLLTSDKPLYQPGQSFSVRGLYFDANSVVVSGAEMEFSIKDQDDAVLFRQTVKTSDFGIASVSWKIPENAKLGDYRVVVETGDELQADQLIFKVSRYNLPNFSVAAKADKPYYLPGDTRAEIAVNADYLFGKPVTKGKVRVVQESDRRWNWHTQQYDAEEKGAVEGETDADGKFIARLDLAKENKELQERGWRRFEDLKFAAYYTDVSTNRTEQKRFEIRLTKEPIHIYLARYDYQNAKLPLRAYISTFYADGTPAVCDVEFKNSGETVEKIKTNSLGAGKIKVSIPDSYANRREFPLQIIARDKKGRLGTYDENFSLGNEDNALQVTTQQTIYKPGDMIDVQLASTQQNGFIYVDVVKDWAVIDTRIARLKNGKAFVSIPYRPEFKGELTVGAYSDQETSRWSNQMRSSRGIIFPEQQNLRLDAKFSSATYRPNADAKVKFSVFDGSGTPAESALGVAVFDKAVEQRAKTDAEFGSYFSRFNSLMGYDKSYGSLSVKDLNDLDLSKPISPEIELAAEVMLAGNYYYPQIYHQGGTESDAKAAYQQYFQKQLKPVEAVLKNRFEVNHTFPADEASLKQTLLQGGIDITAMQDPWGQPYRAEFSTVKSQAVDTLKSAGPDKIYGNDDDITVASVGVPYFQPTGEAIDKAVLAFHNQADKYINDLPTLSAAASKFGVDLARLRDRWNRPYKIIFEVAGRNYVIRIHSFGPNGSEEANAWNSDDFDIWKTYTEYFHGTEIEINRILAEEVNMAKKPFPKNEAEFAGLLKKNGLDLSFVLEGYGRPVYVAALEQPRYSDTVVYENGKQTVKPATETVRSFSIRSRGSDPFNENDDFDLATFSSVITSRIAADDTSKFDVRLVTYSGAKGAISGIINDALGAVIPGATVIAFDENDETKSYSTITNDAGEFLLGNLDSGKYRVKVTAPNFKSAIVAHIEVRSQNLVKMDVRLEVGGISETVTVTGVAELIDLTVNASVSTVTTKNGVKISFPYADQRSTPRLREYFPETLVWQPELLTDKKGRAEMSFKMADNITTWKMYTIASTKKGKIGVAEKEITAFQPFFVDLDPPKFLTEGDEIFLPSQVRNYTDKKQSVDVTMARADWFSVLGADRQKVDVESGGSKNAVFGFKAATAVKEGKQRLTAIAQGESDAIEKPVTVRPNGQEVVRTDSKFGNGAASFDLKFPTTALPGTPKAELKIYPNLFAHVTEAVTGLLERPYGCGEQTISSTYPNLMILKFVKNESPLRIKAKKYLQAGYERLIGYQAANGGFTYWGGKSEPDVALTAYAIRFLTDSKSQIDVDEDVIKKAETWLINQQRTDGSWVKKYYWQSTEDAAQTKLMTTYVARTLAMAKTRDKAALAKVLDYLKARNAEIDEPYALALYGLASLDSGITADATLIATKLEKMGLEEGGAAYWKLETNTPFYGWGTAGRLETTALVLQLLIREAAAKGIQTPERKALISKATLFLLKNKDRYGVWYSTQTTINVLDAFLAALNSRALQNQAITVTANGQPIEQLAVPANKIDPITVDLTARLAPGENRIDIRGNDGSPLMAQIVSSHYIDWRDSDAANRTVNQSRSLKLDYTCDKTTAAIMQEIKCTAAVERVGFQGYGMLLAEIGIPPGADVSRESLDNAMAADWSISHYDILPDRIVVYMWAKAGGTKLNFSFKPRYAINAQTPASVVYDYYNPEAQAAVTPLRFLVK